MRNIGNNVMKTVKVNKLALLHTVKENLEKHTAEYNEAVKDYLVAVENIAKENHLEAIKQQLDSKYKSFPAVPTSYVQNYEKAIKMLEYSVEDELIIDDTTFNQLVLDEWSWKGNFSSLVSSYKAFI